MPDTPPATDAITVEELFTMLSFGELSNLSMSGEGNGTIAEGSQGKIIYYTNKALLELYSRYAIRSKEVIVKMIGGYTNYFLYKRYAQSRPNEDSTDPVYIIDATNPFKQDVIKVLDIYSASGWKYPLNDEENRFSLFTPYPNQIQIPMPEPDYLLSVIYQAKHPKLQYGVLSQLIYLPEVLHGALTSFIASEVFSHIGGPENTAKGAEHLAKYEAACKKAEDQDLVSTAISTTNTVFKQRGWV